MTTTDIVLRLYSAVLASQSAQATKLAEQELLSIESSPYFVYANMALLFTEHSSLALKQYAATYLSGFVNRLLKKDMPFMRGQPSLEACSENLEKLIVVIQTPLLELEVKLMLKAPISELLHFLDDKGNQRATRNQKFFKLILDAQRNQNGEVDFAFIAIYAQAYICQEAYNKNIEELVHQVFPLLCKLALRVQQFALIRHPALRKQLPNILEILKEYSSLIKLYSRKYFCLSASTLTKFDFSIIERLLVSALQFTSPASISGSFLYTYVPNDKEASKKINIYKANYLSIFSSALKIPQKHKNFPALAFQAINELVAQVFGSTAELLKYQRYFQLKQDYMLSYLLNKVLVFLYWCCKYQQFKPQGIFFKISGQLVERVLMCCLEFSPNDLELLHEKNDNENFVSNLGSITFLHVPQDYSWGDHYEEKNSCEMIKITSAALLSLLCQMDRTLLQQLLRIASETIKKKNCQKSSKMLLILCIIGPLCRQKPFFSQLVAIFKEFTLEIKDFSPCSYEELQFALLLKFTSHLDFVLRTIQKDKNKLLDIGKNIILSPYCKTASMRKLSILIFQSIAHHLNESGTNFDLIMLSILNSIISLADGCLVFLLEQYQVIFYSMSSCPEMFKDIKDKITQSKQIRSTIKLVGEVIVKELQKESSRENVIKQACKIYKDIKEIEGINPEILIFIQKTFQTLLATEYQAEDIQFQKELYSITFSLIRQNQKINETQLGIINTIPRFFYGKNKCRFDGILEIVLLFLHDKKPSDVVFEFLKMAFDEMTMISCGSGDIDYGFEGVLVLQSIVSQRFRQLKKEHWQSIIQTTLKILEGISPNNKLYFTNLNALLALTLAYSCKHFSDDENQLLITRILSTLPSFDLENHASKVMVLAFSELLVIPEQEFVGIRLKAILEALIDLFKQISDYRLNFHQSKTKYTENLKFFRGPITEVAFSQFFVNKFKKIKLTKLPIFQKNFASLTEENQTFFNEQILGNKSATGSNKESSKWY